MVTYTELMLLGILIFYEYELDRKTPQFTSDFGSFLLPLSELYLVILTIKNACDISPLPPS